MNQMLLLAKRDNSFTVKAPDLEIVVLEILYNDGNLLHDYEKLIYRLRKLKTLTPAEKRRSSYIPPHDAAIFNHSSIQN